MSRSSTFKRQDSHIAVCTAAFTEHQWMNQWWVCAIYLACCTHVLHLHWPSNCFSRHLKALQKWFGKERKYPVSWFSLRMWSWLIWHRKVHVKWEDGDTRSDRWIFGDLSNRVLMTFAWWTEASLQGCPYSNTEDQGFDDEVSMTPSLVLIHSIFSELTKPRK